MSETSAPRAAPSWSLAANLHGRDNNFNLIRFVAATSVILFHCHALLGHPDGDLFRRWTGGLADFGYLGVFVFFVVSGFLMTMFVRQGPVAAFIAARVLRIYRGPTLAALLTVAIGMACWTVPAIC
jgi:peptidoglycan/LPS O-acetylase OafA/YrhL